MNFGKKALMIVTMMAVGAAAFAGTALPKEIELVDGYATSYEVAPTESVLAFLEAKGIDTGLIAGNKLAFNGQLASLMRVEPVDEDGDGEIQSDEWLKRQLVDTVNRALFGEFTGENVVYMELGSYRWIISPSTWEAEEE